jgi:hypothetical protein
VIVDGGRNQVLEVKSEAEIEGVWDLTMRQGDLAYALLHDLPFARFFPKDSRLVVRPAALQELEIRISPEPGHGIEITNSSKDQERQIISQKSGYSQAKLDQWYRRRVASWPTSKVPPSRDHDLRDAKAEGFKSVP